MVWPGALRIFGLLRYPSRVGSGWLRCVVMADNERPLILDAAGEPIGRYRYNQNPEDPQRVHPVPVLGQDGNPVVLRIPKVDDNGQVVTDRDGNPVIDREEVQTELVPIEFERAQAQIAADGLAQDPDAPHVLIAADTGQAPAADTPEAGDAPATV